MNDYAFGNYLYDCRKKAGLTQSRLAQMLGVTDKAVSKWETGKAKPSTNLIRKIAVGSLVKPKSMQMNSRL